MTRSLFLFSVLLIFIFSQPAFAAPAQYPYALITSAQGSGFNLYAEPGRDSVIYANATLHIFAHKNTSYAVYINTHLYEKNITQSEHTEIRMHLNASVTEIQVQISNFTFIFKVHVTYHTISESDFEVLKHMLEIPPWEWSAHEWAVFGDTVLGALLAIPFSIVFSRYMILRKWGGANVIS